MRLSTRRQKVSLVKHQSELEDRAIAAHPHNDTF